MVISHSILEKQRKWNCRELEMKQMYREKQIWKEYLMGFRVLDFRYFCYPWVPWAIINIYIGNLLCTSPFITSDCVQMIPHWFPLFFFLSASHLKSGPHTLASCPGLLWHCRGQGESSLVPIQCTQKYTPVGFGNASHWVPSTEVCRRSQQEHAPVS